MSSPWDGPADSLAPLDEAQLDAVCAGDREFEALVVGEFRAATESALRELAGAIAAQDPEKTKAWAHAIKGGSATLGGQAVARTCQQLEDLVFTSPDWAAAAALHAELNAAYGVLDRALRARGAAAA